MDRRQFLYLAAVSSFLLVTACDSPKQEEMLPEPVDDFDRAFDRHFLELGKNDLTFETDEALRFTSGNFYWSDGRNGGLVVFFKGVKPNEIVPIHNFIIEPKKVFVQDKTARTVVFGKGKLGSFSMYSAKGVKTRTFVSEQAVEASDEQIKDTLKVLEAQYNYRTKR